MPCSQGLATLLACWLLRLPWVGANPSLDFPVNAQVPPVARTSQPYTFVFSASTFTSADGPISYTLSSQPSWLRLIDGSRTFSGTPEPEDVGAATFNLIAADSSGSTSASVTFVVLASSGPEVAQPVLPQLARIGPTSGPSSLLLRPLQDFAFNFDAETFANTNADTKLYAVSANNTPLPNWVQFDSSSLAFSGTSPPLVSSTAAPQIYGIKLVASDVAGFSEATIDFQLVVGYHVLTATDVHQAINITPGEEFSSTNFRENLTLDNQIVADSAITSVTSNGPEWVHLDASAISLDGIPPAEAKSTNVTISILDVYSDILNIIVELIAVSDPVSLFTGTLPDANATAGDSFSYTINATRLISKQVHLSADLGSASTWLHFSPQNRILYGDVPIKVPAGPQTITLMATEGILFESRSFAIHVMPPQHISDSSTTKMTSSTKTSILGATAASGSATFQPSPGRSLMSRNNAIEIILATVLPAVLIILIICSMLWWRCTRARQRRRRKSTLQEAIIRPEAIRTPTPEVTEVPPVPRTPERSPMRGIPSRPPQIELPWAPDSMRISRNRMSKKLRATPAASVGSIWGDFVVAETGSALAERPSSIRTINATESLSQDDVPSLREMTLDYSQKRSTRSTQLVRQEFVSKRSSERYSATSIASPGLPHRLSGAGHGAGGETPTTYGEVRSSWQTTMETVPGLESKRSTAVLKDFPSPAHDTSGRDMSTILRTRSPNRPPQATVRMVRSDSARSSGLQKWYTDRARDKLEGSARFSSTSSRPSSSSRLLWEDSLGARAISKALILDSGSSNRNKPQSLSGIARGRRMTSTQRLGGSSFYKRTPLKLRGDISTASSGQFDSATSADSWEDENLVEEENEDGVNQWQRGEAGDTPPRLPFDAVPTSPQGVASPVIPPRRWRLASNTKPGSVPDRQTKRSEESEKGALAFV